MCFITLSQQSSGKSEMLFSAWFSSVVHNQAALNQMSFSPHSLLSSKHYGRVPGIWSCVRLPTLSLGKQKQMCGRSSICLSMGLCLIASSSHLPIQDIQAAHPPVCALNLQKKKQARWNLEISKMLPIFGIYCNYVEKRTMLKLC